MSKTRYIEKTEDGTVRVHEITEKVWELHEGALDTSIETEQDPEKKEFLKNLKRLKVKTKGEYGMLKAEIDKKIKEQKNKLKE